MRSNSLSWDVQGGGMAASACGVFMQLSMMKAEAIGHGTRLF
jgi:hypothetical protein